MSKLLETPLTPRSLVDSTTERLEAAILTGEIAGGAKLQEKPLAASLGVSRSVVREAIRRLEGRHLVSRTPFIGAQVALLSRDDLLEIMEVRELLEGMACRLAALAMSDKEVRDLKMVIERQHAGKPEKHSASSYIKPVDYDFHYKIIIGARNKHLFRMLCGDLFYLLKVYRFRSGTVLEREDEVLHEHRAIADAIAAEDADLAEALMREHIRNSRENMIQCFELAGAESDDAPSRSDASDRTPPPRRTREARTRRGASPSRH